MPRCLAVFQMMGVLPILPLLFPVLWVLTNAYGEARVLAESSRTSPTGLVRPRPPAIAKLTPRLAVLHVCIVAIPNSDGCLTAFMPRYHVQG